MIFRLYCKIIIRLNIYRPQVISIYSGTCELRPLKGLSSTALTSQVVSIARLECRPIHVYPVLICNVMTIQICTVLIKQTEAHSTQRPPQSLFFVSKCCQLRFFQCRNPLPNHVDFGRTQRF